MLQNILRMFRVLLHVKSCRYGKRATAYTVPVALLTFKVIQGQ